MTPPAPDIAHKNLFRLNQIHPETAKGLLHHLQTQRKRGESSKFQVVMTPSGQPTLRQTVENHYVDLHDPNHPAAASQAYAKEILNTINHASSGVFSTPRPAIWVWSCGLGYLPCALAPGIDHIRLVVLEPEYDLLFESFRVSDWEPLLRSSHLLILAGPQAQTQAFELLDQHGSLLQEGYRFFPGRILREDETGAYRALETRLSESQRRFVRISRLPLEKKGEGIVVASTDAHQELLPILCREGESLGLSLRPGLRKAAVSRFLQTEAMWWETLGRPLPGNVLTFSESVFSPTEWSKIKDAGIQRFLWCYDDPFRRSLDDDFFRHLDRIFCFDPFLTEILQRKSPIPVDYLPAATSFGSGYPAFDSTNPITDLLDNRPLPSVTFVGSTGLQRFDDSILREIVQPSRLYSSIRNYVVSRLSQGRSINYLELLSLPVSETAGYSRTMLLEDLATFAVRQYYLSVLSQDTAEIFGDSGWAEPSLVGNANRLYAGWPLDYLQETPWVYRHGKINLNIFNVQCVNAPTVRLLDIMACGGFLLTEYRPFLETLFCIGQELDVFRAREELHEKVDFYLQHEDRRQAIAEAGRDRVLREHRYRDRLQFIFHPKKDSPA